MRCKQKFRNPLIITLLIFALSSNLISSKLQLRKVELILTDKVGIGVLNYPGHIMGYNISAVDDEHFYLYDSKGKFPFYALEKSSLKLKGFGSWGQGPGELEMGSPVTLSVTRSKIFVYLPMQMRILVFQKDLRFLEEMRIERSDIGSTFYMIGDNEGIYVSSFPGQESKSFGEKYIIEERGKISPTSVHYCEYKKFPQIESLKNNPMLKKGPIHVDRNGNIYFAHYYSSLRMGFSPEGGVIFVNSDPRNIKIPEAEIRKIGNVITGDPERSIQCYLALSSDDKYLYGLFSGEEITMEKIVAMRTGKGKLNLGEGKFVDVFNKKDGSYMFSFELPKLATSIAVDKDSLYVTTIDGEPSLLIFRKPKF